MAINAAPLALPITEEQDILMVSHNVKAKLLILIRGSIFENSDANYLAFLLIQNVLQPIQVLAVANACTMEVALVHSCQEEAPHAIRLFIPE
jgi:hypothetical protein